jgi:hypothetical protein
MKSNLYKRQIIMFGVMVIVGILFNPMNILAYSFSDLYLSQTLFYGGLLMASNMIWAHEIIHYLSMGHFNSFVFSVGIILSIGATMLLRQQLYVDDKQWLRRMIPHHSTALTTTEKLLKNENNFKYNPPLFRLAKEIALGQKREILLMKSLL